MKEPNTHAQKKSKNHIYFLAVPKNMKIDFEGYSLSKGQKISKEIFLAFLLDPPKTNEKICLILA